MAQKRRLGGNNMIIYQYCPKCGYGGHISTFGRAVIGNRNLLVCPRCSEKFAIDF